MEYYDSAHDKPRKPYIPIDTNSPAGTWIEEKRYNKSRPTQSQASNSNGRIHGSASGGMSRKVLCGNWQEEAALEGDMLAGEVDAHRRIEQEKMTASMDPSKTTTPAELAARAAMLLSTANNGASLDVIRDTAGSGRFAGGFESSPFLTADAARPNQRLLDSTYRVDYNAKGSDVGQLQRPALGVRSHLLLKQSLDAARAAQAQAAADAADSQAGHAARMSTIRGANGGSTAALADPGTVHDTSVYRATISEPRAADGCSTSHDHPRIDGLRQAYLDDVPITLYTGNPQSGKTMTVHGKTPVDPVSASQFGKHTTFSEPKYHL